MRATTDADQSSLARRVLTAAKKRYIWLRLPASVRKNRREDEALRNVIRALGPAANCVDIGANVGEILAAMVDACPDGQHIAFEPVPALNADLCARFPGVDVRNTATSDRPGSISFTVVPGRPSRSGISSTLDLTLDLATESVEVATTTLDSALPSGYVPTLVKIDVEGAELETLMGASQTLSHRPLVAFEHQYGRKKSPLRTGAIFDLLAGHGYSIRTMQDEVLSREKFLHVVDAGSEWNFLASAM